MVAYFSPLARSRTYRLMREISSGIWTGSGEPLRNAPCNSDAKIAELTPLPETSATTVDQQSGAISRMSK